MSDLVRLSFSIEKSLYDRLEDLVSEAQYQNRSEFIRDLIRNRLVEKEWRSDEDAFGTITVVYEHHTRGLTEKLTRIQHRHHGVIRASTHVHLDVHVCVEVILVKGKASEIQRLTNLLRREKGVLHGTLSLTTTGTHFL
jgi:CopG family transcriptional regulator, nickel-responsive regulator